MKKVICLLVAYVLLLCSCASVDQPKESASHIQQDEISPNEQPKEITVFTWNENDNLVSAAGVEYSFLSTKALSSLTCLGQWEFIGHIQGEPETSTHLTLTYQTGMYSAKDNDNILIRYAPNNEWYSLYRKTSLPSFDFSVDNCIRLELVSGIGNAESDAIHATCDDGIVDAAKIAEFLSHIRSQKGPREAGLYDLIKKPNGMLKNCYVYGVIYGFFEEEANIVVRMDITSYNDLAYSISIEGKDYVLPTEWLQTFQNK